MSHHIKAQEPSIEDILASIRRSIISDDDAGEPASAEGAPARSPSRAKADAKRAVAKKAHEKNGQDNADALAGFDVAANEEPDDPVRGRPAADVIALGEATHANAAAVDAVDRSADAGADGAATPVRQRAPRGPRAMPVPEGALLSPRTTAAVDTAFNSLSHTALTQNPRTLEDLVRDMLKPMLKAWLDDNLPNMVERLVRAEIERVSRGRG
jgi:cell pole-organizing protein PopZ